MLINVLCFPPVSDSYVSDVEAYVLFYRSVSGSLHLARFFITLSPNGPFGSNTFFRPNTISRVAIIKTTSPKIVFCLLLLSFSSLFLFLLSFSFETMILKLLRLKKPAFWLLLTQMTANFPRLVFKKFVRHTIA